jgi:hypothetical protein
MDGCDLWPACWMARTCLECAGEAADPRGANPKVVRCRIVAPSGLWVAFFFGVYSPFELSVLTGGTI